jgi:hypothetical protein
VSAKVAFDHIEGFSAHGLRFARPVLLTATLHNLNHKGLYGIDLPVLEVIQGGIDGSLYGDDMAGCMTGSVTHRNSPQTLRDTTPSFLYQPSTLVDIFVEPRPRQSMQL